MPQLVLGIAFSISIPMVFATVLNAIPSTLWWLVIANIVWVVIYDTTYAIGDRHEDIKIGVKSSAILFGRFDKKILIFLQIVLLFLLLQVGLKFDLHGSYYYFLIPIAVTMAYNQRLIKNNDKVMCLKAFLNNNYLGMFILSAIIFSQNYLSIIESFR